MKRKTKQTLKTIGLSALGIAAIVGVASGINAIVKNNQSDLKTIYPTFEVGALDSNGEHVKSSQSIYTQSAFECKGLEIKLDFDNHIEYQVYYYDETGEFLEATEVLNKNHVAVLPPFATHARILITPEWSEMGKDYEKTDNQEIKWYEVTKYSSQIALKVYRDQEQALIRTATYYNYADEKVLIGSFEFEEGMTWNDWLNSDFSKTEIADRIISYSNLLHPDDPECGLSLYYLPTINDDSDWIEVKLTDVIIPGVEYCNS